MNLTQEQIEKLSINLSKILNGNRKLWKNINSILKYVELLDEVNTTWIIPTISVVEKNNTLREDNEYFNHKQNSKELLECSKTKIISNWIAISNIMK